MNKIINGRVLLGVLLMVFSAIASAHAGHDHSQWYSGFSHITYYGAIFASFVLLAYIAYTTLKKAKNNSTHK